MTACADGSLILWDPRSPTPTFKLTPSDARFELDGITSLAINPASSLAVVGGAGGGVRVVSLSKGEIVASLGGHTEGESIEAVQFIEIPGAGAGGVVATGATDGKICIWDLNTMRLRSSLTHEASSAVVPDLMTELSFQDAITCLLAPPAPQNHLIVSGSADKTLRTWDARTGVLLREHRGHQGPVLGASLGLDGSVVVSAGDDGVCLVFTTEATEEP